MFLLLLGMIFHLTGLILLGIIAFSVVVVFQLVNLPVEFDEAKHLVWRTAIPGLGNSSPVVWDNQLFIQTSSADATWCGGSRTSRWTSGPSMS